MAHRLIYWENKKITFEESKKYSSRNAFYKGSHGAYVVSKKNNWLNEMTWLNCKNVYKDPVDSVYKYYFKDSNAVYIGRTIHTEERDKEHRKIKHDTVYKFAKENNMEIPPMEIIEEGLTILEGANKERYWRKYFEEKGYQIINKQPCGSIGYMSRGKWSKEKCFEESKKYHSRSEFQKNCSHAYATAMKKGWIDEMTWLPKKERHPNGFWNDVDKIINEAKKYTKLQDFFQNSPSAYKAARRKGVLNDLTWLEKEKRLPFGYWKNKNHCIEEARKYKSKKEFQRANQSAYWASLKYGYLDEMTWLNQNKVTPSGFYKNNKEMVMEIAKQCQTRGEFEKKDKSAYSAALRYGWLDEMTWMKTPKNKPKEYWDDINNVIKEAKKYQTKKEIKERNSYLYKIMFKKGYLDKLTWLK